MSKIYLDQIAALREIMAKAHALAEIAWPRDALGASAMPDAGLLALVDIQIEAAKALGLPADLDLMTGDPMIDG